MSTNNHLLLYIFTFRISKAQAKVSRREEREERRQKKLHHAVMRLENKELREREKKEKRERKLKRGEEAQARKITPVNKSPSKTGEMEGTLTIH